MVRSAQTSQNLMRVNFRKRADIELYVGTGGLARVYGEVNYDDRVPFNYQSLWWACSGLVVPGSLPLSVSSSHDLHGKVVMLRLPPVRLTIIGNNKVSADGQ